jgi:phosphodiesterase/alkaline phosphatase D-like protein
MRKRIAAVLGAASVAGLLAVAPAAGAQPAAPASISVTASVASQQCQGGDNVLVTLSADATSSSQPVQFRWDFTNNGSFDTRASQNNTVTHVYPDEVNVTARVAAQNPDRERVADTVSFTTLRCEG